MLDGAAGLLANIKKLKSDLGDIIEPDFGLLDHLLSLELLNYRQFANIRSARTVFDRNDVLLELLVSEDQCEKFVKALQQTDQQHVVNVITQNGGQEHHM